MHPNFFHWHARAEMKPEVAHLEPRWNTAVKFAEKPSNADICSLIKLALFPGVTGVDPEFVKRFSEALVKGEPTFPPSENAQSLRVAATAAIFQHLATPSKLGNAFALGLQSANFNGAQAEPICQEIMVRYSEYLAHESERVRPRIQAVTLAKAEKAAETAYSSMKKAIEANSVQEVGKAGETMGRGLLAAIKESHGHLGEIIGRMSEESQFLWWMIGRRSPSLNANRKSLAADEYALPAAAEAVDRVTVLPPAASTEAIIDEALSQCEKKSAENLGPGDILGSVPANWLQNVVPVENARELTPLVSLVSNRPANGQLEASAIKATGLYQNIKFTPSEAARQYFHERIFLRALEDPR